jgi:hypothetical protein
MQHVIDGFLSQQLSKHARNYKVTLYPLALRTSQDTLSPIDKYYERPKRIIFILGYNAATKRSPKCARSTR